MGDAVVNVELLKDNTYRASNTKSSSAPEKKNIRIYAREKKTYVYEYLE